MGGAMKPFEQDKKWSDKFIPRIAELIGPAVIVPAPFEEDAERNTDLIVLKMNSIRIGCRIRKSEYRERYGDEFTIRSGRPSGVKTELTKIIEGWGDMFFYGFSNESETDLAQWFLGDMKVFRLWFNRHMAEHQGKQPGTGRCNNDNSSDFRAFKLEDLPAQFIVDSSTRRTK